MAEHSFRIRKAAELSGVSEDLIRAWERRYGVIQPERTPGGYRVYSPEDIALLKRLRQLTLDGMSIAEAARLVPSLRKEIERAQAPVAPAPEGAPLGSWRTLALEAIRDFDQRRVEAVLNQAFSALPPLQVLDALVMPLLREVGTCWEEGSISIAAEHLATQAMRMRLVSLLHGAPDGARKHVLCACFPEEQHELGLLAAALRFRHAGMRVTYLGQRTPADELAEVLRQLQPELMALSCVTDPGPATLEATLRAVLSALPPGSQVVVGGRSAERHAELCQKLGARVFLQDADWERLLV